MSRKGFLCLNCGNELHDGSCKSVVIDWRLFTEEQKTFISSLGTLAFQVLERINEEPLSLARCSHYEAYELLKFVHYHFIKSMVDENGFMSFGITRFGRGALQFSPP